MNQVAIREEICFDTVLRDVESMQTMCAKLMRTKHYQTMGEAGLFAIVQKAKSLNIHPLEALNGGLYFVQGKVGMSSEMMASLIRGKGHSIVKDPRSDNTVCILRGKRADNGDTWDVSFSIDDAKRAGLLKNMWDKYPAVMLYNRCMSMLARQLFPDVIKGAGYTHDELIEIKNNNVTTTFTHQENIKDEKSNTISESEVKSLLEAISKCDVEYQKDVMDFIKSPPISITNLTDMPVALYQKIMKKTVKKLEDMKAELEQSEIQEIEEGEE